MADATTRIRNLSIALEAVSRIGHPNLGDDIYILLVHEVQTLQEKKRLPSAAQPAKSTFEDDDIPF